MNFLFWGCLILGILSLLYYLIIISYAGLSAAFSGFWLVVGILCFLMCIIIRHIRINEIEVAKPYRIALLLLFATGMFAFIVLEGNILYHGAQSGDKGADYLIVLGAQVKKTTVSKTLRKRLDTALNYLKDNPESKVIVSGGRGQGEDITEAEAMELYLITMGIAEDRIIQENKSTNTNENIRFSKKLIREKNANVAIVTNGFHIYRALKIAEKQGIKEVQGISAPTDPILCIHYYVREAAGVLKDKLVGNL